MEISQLAKCMGPTWVLSAHDGPNVGPMNLAIGDVYQETSPTPNWITYCIYIMSAGV